MDLRTALAFEAETQASLMTQADFHEAYDAFVNVTQQRVTGTVTLRLYKGSVNVVGRESVHALYDERFVTFGEDDVYEQSDAAGFIRLFALPSRVRAIKDQELAAAHSSGNGTSPVTASAASLPDAEPSPAGELAGVDDEHRRAGTNHPPG